MHEHQSTRELGQPSLREQRLLQTIAYYRRQLAVLEDRTDGLDALMAPVYRDLLQRQTKRLAACTYARRYGEPVPTCALA